MQHDDKPNPSITSFALTPSDWDSAHLLERQRWRLCIHRQMGTYVGTTLCPAGPQALQSSSWPPPQLPQPGPHWASMVVFASTQPAWSSTHVTWMWSCAGAQPLCISSSSHLHRDIKYLQVCHDMTYGDLAKKSWTTADAKISPVFPSEIV